MTESRVCEGKPCQVGFASAVYRKVSAPSCVQAVAAKADYKVQWGTLHEKKYLPLKKRHAALEQCVVCISCFWCLCGRHHPYAGLHASGCSVLISQL